MTKQKVYCIDCKHVIVADEGCKHPNNTTHVNTPLFRQPIYKSIKECNGGNNCPNFEQKEIWEPPLTD
jgi:hypothetical protein